MTSCSEVYTQATQTEPVVVAQIEIHQIRQRLQDRLTTLIGNLDSSAGLHDTVDFCRAELRRHLAAADEALYEPAAGAAETRLLVRALRAAAATLDQRIDALAAADDPAAAAAVARDIAALLAVHSTMEQTVLLPALVALAGADFPSFSADLQTLLDGPTPARCAGTPRPGSDGGVSGTDG